MNKSCKIHDIFVSSQIPCTFSAWNSRIVCVNVTERGFIFKRGNPNLSQDELCLNQEMLDKSFWVRRDNEPIKKLSPIEKLKEISDYGLTYPGRGYTCAKMAENFLINWKT
jgi:hypothetical protein